MRDINFYYKISLKIFLVTQLYNDTIFKEEMEDLSVDKELQNKR